MVSLLLTRATMNIFVHTNHSECRILLVSLNSPPPVGLLQMLRLQFEFPQFPFEEDSNCKQKAQHSVLLIFIKLMNVP